MASSKSAREVFVTYIDSPNKFFVIDGEKLSELDAIRLELEKETAKYAIPGGDFSSDLLTSHDWKPFSPCIASWQGRWYRARVLSRRSDGKFEVEYVDYGNTDYVDSVAVKKRPSNDLISRRDPLSWPCRLSGETHHMDKKRFDEICENVQGRFRMVADDVDDESGQQVVTLFWDDGQRHRCVNEAVIGISPQKQAPPPAEPSRQYYNVGRMGQKLFRETTANAEVNNNAAASVIEFPLVDLSEPAAMGLTQEANEQRAAGNRSNVTIMGSRFMSDLDAILDGPIEDFESDDDEENATASRATGRPSGIPAPRVIHTNWSNSSDSGHSGSVEDDSLRALKQKWAHLLSLRYGAGRTPAPGSLSAEQQVAVTRIISPTAFYAQTTRQRDGLRRLELSMADEFSPSQPPIPSMFVKPGVCCSVFSDVSKTWRRAQVIRVNRPNSTGNQLMTADVFLIDTGYERCFPVGALKPINEHFTTYLPLVFYVKLSHGFFEGIHWRLEDTERFRQLVENRALIMKFLTNTAPAPEVELIDMNHSCVLCASRVKKCTINDLVMQWIQRNGGLGVRM